MQAKTMFSIALGVVLITASPAVAIDANPGQEMAEGRVAATPLGFKNFCKVEKEHCQAFRDTGNPERMALSTTRYDELVEINSTVNAEITPVPEFGIFTSVRDNWKLPTSSGDCEDYALLKQARLIEKGWPESALLITVADMPDGTRHAVLTVRTDSGDFILDNITDRVLDWQQVNYRWIKRQSARNMMRWVEIKPEATRLISSVVGHKALLNGLII